MKENTATQYLIPVYSSDVPQSSALGICTCKTGYMVKPVNNLDQIKKDGFCGFVKNPETRQPIHAGLTKLRASGCYVLVKEERYLRWATVISDEEAYCFIMGAGKAALLKTMKFSRLMRFLTEGGAMKPWTKAERWERVKWTPAQLKEIERRNKYVGKKNRGATYVYQQ